MAAVLRQVNMNASHPVPSPLPKTLTVTLSHNYDVLIPMWHKCSKAGEESSDMSQMAPGQTCNKLIIALQKPYTCLYTPIAITCNCCSVTWKIQKHDNYTCLHNQWTALARKPFKITATQTPQKTRTVDGELKSCTVHGSPPLLGPTENILLRHDHRVKPNTSPNTSPPQKPFNRHYVLASSFPTAASLNKHSVRFALPTQRPFKSQNILHQASAASQLTFTTISSTTKYTKWTLL